MTDTYRFETLQVHTSSMPARSSAAPRRYRYVTSVTSKTRLCFQGGSKDRPPLPGSNAHELTQAVAT